MKIAITSRIYFPSHGGVPVYTRLLGNAFHNLGHEVRLFTSTPANVQMDSDECFEIIRSHQIASCLKLAKWCDVLLQVELSLGLIWPFVVFQRPCFISHHTHFTSEAGPDLVRSLYGWTAAKCHPISVSELLKKSWGGHGVVIGNPYDDKVFRCGQETRDNELLFVGRLVPDKGCDVLLKALLKLRKWQMFPKLNVIGDDGRHGVSALPEWRELAKNMGLEDQVTFLGGMPSHEVAAAMRASRILVIPSTWLEPFGIVALEGLACGCKVIASAHGGLREACGDFATYFENGNDDSLAIALKSALTEPDKNENLALSAHLKAHQAAAVAERYVRHFMSVIQKHRNS